MDKIKANSLFKTECYSVSFFYRCDKINQNYGVAFCDIEYYLRRSDFQQLKEIGRLLALNDFRYRRSGQHISLSDINIVKSSSIMKDNSDTRLYISSYMANELNSIEKEKDSLYYEAIRKMYRLFAPYYGKEV